MESPPLKYPILKSRLLETGVGLGKRVIGSAGDTETTSLQCLVYSNGISAWIKEARRRIKKVKKRKGLRCK